MTAATTGDGAARSLTVACWHGLGNRLRLLITGMTVAAASARRFTMLWPRTRDCAAAFCDLFANDWPVEETPLADVKDMPPYFGYYCPPLPDPLTSPARDLRILTPHALLAPTRLRVHAALMPHAAATMAALQLKPALAAQVAAFQATAFRRQMIGVHLRRGDFNYYALNAARNLHSSFQAVDAWLKRWPEAGILLCSDDGAADPLRPRAQRQGVHQAYRQRYGARVVWHVPRSLDRSLVETVQDAAVDLWLLRSTDACVGTLDSSFSEMAVFGRQAPVRWATPDDRRYRAVASLLTMTGVAWLMRHDGRRRFGRELSLPRLLHYYRSRLRGHSMQNNANDWQKHELVSSPAANGEPQ